MTLLLDFESTSKADLRAVGGRLYAQHPTTQALVCVMHDTESGATGAWFPGDGPVALPADVGAHNWDGFDRHIAARLGWGDVRDGVDTAVLARRAGLPGALDALGVRMGHAKDKIASRFTVSLSRYDDIADAPPPAPPAADDADKKARARERTRALKEWRARPVDERRRHVLEIVTRYCASDVAIMVEGWPMLRPFLEDGVFAGWEGDVLQVDRIVNDRGIAFDSDLARRLLAADALGTEKAIEVAAKACGWGVDETRKIVSAPGQLAAVLGTADATAETVAAISKAGSFEHEEWKIRLCEARQALATIARGKLEAGLARVSADGRLRDSHRYYGAHTGRWSGRGMQLQNLPRPDNRFEKWGDAEIAQYCAGAPVDGIPWGDPDGIMVALRACLTASPGNELAVCDFSGVEARALAWVAGDAAALDVFRSGKDPYKAAASVIFGIPADTIEKNSKERDIGKKAELACGYGMGAPKFEARYEPSRVGVDAAEIVAGWRKLHAPIVAYWRRLEDAFVAAVRGTESREEPFAFVPGSDGQGVAIILPSGRPIVYNATGLEREIGFNGGARLSAYYVGTKSGREHLYGGKIAENVIQAMCRDLMADALVRAERAGLAPVLHVHDELVCQVPRGREGYAALHEIMTTLPEWAESFPVGAAGHWGFRYRK